MHEEMMLEEEQVLEPENAEEQTAEETVEGEENTTEEETKPKMYTEEEVEQLVNKRVDEILPSKLERGKAKIRREFEEEFAPYREAEAVLNAGMNTNGIKDATKQLREYYQDKGITIPESTRYTGYSEADMKILAENEAREIKALGFDEVVEEVERLSRKGADRMTEREKLVFAELAGYRDAEESRQELLEIGAKGDVIDSSEFKEFASQFNQKTPMKQVYELYTKTHETKPHIEKMDSMKNQGGREEKEFYTSDEVDKLTAKDYDDPKVMERVRKSMLSGKW